jgi:hypothetical protein
LEGFAQMVNPAIQTIPTPTKNLEAIIAERLKKEQQEAERQLAEERRKHEAKTKLLREELEERV